MHQMGKLQKTHVFVDVSEAAFPTVINEYSKEKKST